MSSAIIYETGRVVSPPLEKNAVVEETKIINRSRQLAPPWRPPRLFQNRRTRPLLAAYLLPQASFPTISLFYWNKWNAVRTTEKLQNATRRDDDVVATDFTQRSRLSSLRQR